LLVYQNEPRINAQNADLNRAEANSIFHPFQIRAYPRKSAASLVRWTANNLIKIELLRLYSRIFVG